MNGLKRILDRLGLKQSEFAKLLDVSPRTVSLWATGEVEIPGPVRAYLRMLQTVDGRMRAAELSRLSGPQLAFEDGLYSLTYSDDLSRRRENRKGQAVALLKAGRIVGSDVAGGLFEGTYKFDTSRQSNHFHIRLRVPPTAKLLADGSADTVVEVTAEFKRAGPVASTVVQVGGRPFGLELAYLGPLSL